MLSKSVSTKRGLDDGQFELSPWRPDCDCGTCRRCRSAARDAQRRSQTPAPTQQRTRYRDGSERSYDGAGVNWRGEASFKRETPAGDQGLDGVHPGDAR